jgi:tetratricopeptide (TPR) repeat protein
LALGIALIAGSFASTIWVQAGQNDGAAEASAAYAAKEWSKSAQHGALVKAHPEIPQLWFRLGTSQQELGQLDLALQTMEQGLKAGLPPIFAEFAIGTIYAQKGDKEKAFGHLQQALDNGC